MTLKCPFCGKAPPDTCFFPIMESDQPLTLCVVCNNVSAGDCDRGPLVRPTDAQLADNLVAIQGTMEIVNQVAKGVRDVPVPQPHDDTIEKDSFTVNKDRLEFCFGRKRSDKHVSMLVRKTIEALGGDGAIAFQVGGKKLKRLPCGTKPGFDHVRVQVVAVEIGKEKSGSAE